MLKYTVGFIKQENEILMLNRHYSPNMGKWNGVGGKFEKNETPSECMIREVYEETGIIVSKEDLNYKGVVTWESENGNSGMYVFIIEFFQKDQYTTPKKTEEGILSWKNIEWICDFNNSGVVSHIPYFLPFTLQNDQICEHRFLFTNNTVQKYERFYLS